MKVEKKETIEAKIIQNQGIIQIADIVAEGISKQYAIKYLQGRNCERVAKGVYLAPDVWQDDLYIISLQYKKIAYSYGAALYLLGLSEQEPVCFTVTVPKASGGEKAGFIRCRAYGEGYLGPAAAVWL